MKKIYLSLAIIVAAGAVIAGATGALFSDTEASTGNIFVAGSIDMKVDHTKQTYNDVDCKTCDVTVVSDGSNLVVKKNGNPVTPYNAVFVGSNGGFIHPAWTAQNDPDLVAANAKWIWESDPTAQADVTTDVTYTFQKSFQWFGPIVGSDLTMAVGSDNGVEVYLNNVLIGSNTGEFGYLQGSMLHIPAANITSQIIQGNNVLEFRVTNMGQQGGTPYSNPAGLIYKFHIDGNCGDNYFKRTCNLWGETDLTNQKFYNFDDVKPGDHGVNVISLHTLGNDANACLIVSGVSDQENQIINSETKAGDVTTPQGELSKYLKIFAWDDKNQDGVFNPPTESQLLAPNTALSAEVISLVLTGNGPVEYIGTAWCAGVQTVDLDGTIHCNGAGNQNDAQTDSMAATLTAYAEQVRNNPNFSCAAVQQQLNNPEVPVGPHD